MTPRPQTDYPTEFRAWADDNEQRGGVNPMVPVHRDTLRAAAVAITSLREQNERLMRIRDAVVQNKDMIAGGSFTTLGAIADASLRQQVDALTDQRDTAHGQNTALVRTLRGQRTEIDALREQVDEARGLPLWHVAYRMSGPSRLMHGNTEVARGGELMHPILVQVALHMNTFLDRSRSTEEPKSHDHGPFDAFCAEHPRKTWGYAPESSPAKPHRDPNCEANVYADDCDCLAPTKEDR